MRFFYFFEIGFYRSRIDEVPKGFYFYLPFFGQKRAFLLLFLRTTLLCAATRGVYRDRSEQQERIFLTILFYIFI